MVKESRESESNIRIQTARADLHQPKDTARREGRLLSTSVRWLVDNLVLQNTTRTIHDARICYCWINLLR